MGNLILGVQYITAEDRSLLSFYGARITKKCIQKFAERLTFSDACLLNVAKFPAQQVLRYGIMLAFAAMKSVDYTTKIVNGFRITIHSSYLNGGQVFLDVDRENILFVNALGEGSWKWEISYLSPKVFSADHIREDVLITSILRACKEEC